MGKRGSYFFVLDAIIASMIIVTTILIINNSNFYQPETRQTFLIANDIMDLMVDTSIKDYRNDYINFLFESNIIEDYDQSIADQIAMFHYSGDNDYATNLTKNVIEELLLEQYGISYSIDDTIIYSRTTDRINNSNFVLTSKRIIFVSTNETVFYGPDIGELKIWA